MQPQHVINAIDVTLGGDIQSKGIAYYNPEVDGDFYTFIKDVGKNEKIIGFEWNGEKFGIILSN